MPINIGKLLQSENEKISNKENDIIAYVINKIFSISNYSQEKILQKDLILFEQYAKKYSSSMLFALTGIGWEKFCTLYRKKDQDKTTPLLKAVSLLKKAININPNNEEAKIALASLLVERKQIRNLNFALSILQQVKNQNSETQGLTIKAKRWLENIEFEPKVDYSKIEFIPLNALREERKKCRALVRKYKKEKKYNELNSVLEHMYRVAVLHDVTTYVMMHDITTCVMKENDSNYSVFFETDEVWEKELKKIAKKIYGFSYLKNGKLAGKIKGAPNATVFLSNNDYKAFELIFGETNKTFHPASLVDKKMKTYLQKKHKHKLYDNDY